jgi:hypothetical protein
MRPDLIARLKAFGADDRKIRAVGEMFTDRMIEQMLGQVERTDKEADALNLIRYKIIEEDSPMPPAKPKPLQPYQEGMYNICDILDELAVAKGAHIAQKEVSQTIAQLATRYPAVAEDALGTARRIGYEIAYKATQALGATPTEQGIAQLQAKIGNDDVAALIAALASLTKEQLLQMTQQIAPETGPGRETVTDSGTQSVATKHYDVQRDALAAGFGSDQTQPHRLKAQTSIIAGSSDKGAALKRVSRAVASSDGLGDDSDRVVVATLDRASVHIESHVALQRGR